MSLKFIIPIIIACIVGVGGVAFGVYFVLTRTIVIEPPAVSADIDVNRMLTIIGEESLQRIEGTPLKALTMLADPLQDGSIAVDFSYADPFFGMDVSGMLSLYSNLNDNSFALITEVLVPFIGNLDLSVFLNEERIALQTSILDDNFYGIRFSTLEQDFQTFAAAANLDPFIVEDITMFLTEMELALAALEVYAATYTYDLDDFDYLIPYFEPFAELFREFFDSLEVRRTNVTVGERNVNAVRYSYTAAFEMSLKFLEDFTVLVEDLDMEGLVRETFYAFREQLEAQAELLQDDTFAEQMFDEVIDEAVWEALEIQRELVLELREQIEDFRQEQRDGYRHNPGIMYVYIDNNGRLLRLFLVEEDSIEITLDFGTSVYDPWYFDIITLENWDDDPIALRLDWEFESEDNLMVNRISMDGRGIDGIGSASVVSEWNPSTGDFTKWVEMGGWQMGSIEGNFTVQGGEFELRFSDIDVDGALLSVGITTALGANIPEIDFINMDRWDAALVDRVQDSVLAFMALMF